MIISLIIEVIIGNNSHKYNRKRFGYENNVIKMPYMRKKILL